MGCKWGTWRSVTAARLDGRPYAYPPRCVRTRFEDFCADVRSRTPRRHIHGGVWPAALADLYSAVVDCALP